MLKFVLVQSGPVYSERGATGKRRRQAVMMRIVEGDLNDPRVAALLELHVINARAQTAPGSAHAMDVAALKSPGISFWTIWDDEDLVGMGALKRLSDAHGEIKSVYRAVRTQKRGWNRDVAAHH
jgi:putative acetyltransferase